MSGGTQDIEIPCLHCLKRNSIDFLNLATKQKRSDGGEGNLREASEGVDDGNDIGFGRRAVLRGGYVDSMAQTWVLF